jgi:hypothetical protein
MTRADGADGGEGILDLTIRRRILRDCTNHGFDPILHEWTNIGINGGDARTTTALSIRDNADLYSLRI